MIEENQTKVCRRCATLNDSRSLMCVRCGGSLEITDEQKAEILKGRKISNFWFSILFVVLFTIYFYGIIFYVGPWFKEILQKFGESFIFDFYNNQTLTNITIEVIYVLCLLLLNSLVTILSLEVMVNNKLFDKNRINITSGFIFLYLFIGIPFLTYYKYGYDTVIIIEHLVGVIPVFSKVRKKLLML